MPVLSGHGPVAEHVQIRSARVGDVAAAAAVVERAYGIYVPRIGRRPAPMDADFEQQVRAGQMFVAEADAVVGLIVLIPCEDHLLIENVAVDPEHQQRGIGRALLRFAENYAATAGLAELQLYTNTAMTENLRFYPALGYAETGRRKEAGFDRVFFVKSLAASSEPAPLS